MLRLSPDVIAVGLSPAGLVMSRINRLTRREKQHQALQFPCSLTLAEALEQLGQQLAQAEWQGAAGLRLVLSNHWLRFAVVPWSEQLSSPSERQALAQGLIEELYAEKASRFVIRISESGYGRPGLAAALPQAELQQLQALWGDRFLPLHTSGHAQPALLKQVIAACSTPAAVVIPMHTQSFDAWDRLGLPQKLLKTAPETAYTLKITSSGHPNDAKM